MAPPIPRTVLDPAKAIALWQKGADDWNNWVDKNPDADVSFNNESFSQYRSSINNNTISFNQYNFPNGEVDFRGTKFGDGDVFFHKTTFGEGNVNVSMPCNAASSV